jgi:hypothetical protein
MRAYSNNGLVYRDTLEPQFLQPGEIYFDHIATELELRETYPNRIEAVKKSLVPQQVTMTQARLALFEAGLLSQVQAVIDALPEPLQTTTQIQWDYGTVVNRDDSLVVNLSTQLNLNETALDDLFVLAATL